MNVKKPISGERFKKTIRGSNARINYIILPNLAVTLSHLSQRKNSKVKKFKNKKLKKKAKPFKTAQSTLFKKKTKIFQKEEK